MQKVYNIYHYIKNDMQQSATYQTHDFGGNNYVRQSL